MNIRVSDKIYIEDPSNIIQQFCRNVLVRDNPDYIKKEHMGLWTGNTPATLTLYERIGNCLVLPFGCLSHVFRFAPPQSNVYLPQFTQLRRIDYQSNINLYSYQERAVNEALRAKNGILVMPCGSGKTQCGIELISRIGGRALWLTHTQDLLNQSMSRAKSVLGVDQKSYGTITSGKVNIGTGITFATVQTMSKLDLYQYRDCWDVIITDECQHVCGSPTKVMQFYKVLSNLSARYKYGLTATPKRADGLEICMFATIGPIVTEVSREEVAHTTCPVQLKSFRTGYSPDEDIVLSGDGTLNYAALVDDLTHDTDRFNRVADVIAELNGPTIVLANRVEYLARLNTQYDKRSICLSTMGNSKKAKTERKLALERLNNGELDCIFATYQLSKEGLDVPQLRYVVFATPEKDETTVVQSVGRVARKADGKTHGTVIDFVDSFAMYRGWRKKRERFYKKLGINIDIY